MKFVFFLFIGMLTVVQGQTANKINKHGEDRFNKPELLPGKEREPELEKLKPAKITEEGFYVPISAKIYFKEDVGITEYKDTTIYNEAGRKISKEQKIWKNNTWMEYGKEFSDFDSKGRESAYTSAYITDSGWVGGKRVYTYDENDNLSRVDIFSGLLTDLKPQARTIYGRDSKGYTIEYIVMGWDAKSGGGWVNDYKYVYEADAAGHTISAINYNWNDTGWVKYTLTTYFYNSQFRQTSALTEYFNINGSPNGAWKTEYSYYPSGDLKSSASSIQTGSIWKNYSRSEYTYTDSGDIQTYIYLQWADSLWKNYSRETYTYNDDGNVVLELYEIGENFTSWEEYEKHIFEYDTNGNAAHAESYSWMNGAWVEANGYLGNTFGSYNAQSVDAAYRFIKNPIIGVDEENIHPAVFALEQNYPNPFNPETKISFSLPQSGKASLKVYDMLGREVAELVNGELERGSHTINFNGRNLSSGIYIYRLQAGSFTESKKMALIK